MNFIAKIKYYSGWVSILVNMASTRFFFFFSTFFIYIFLELEITLVKFFIVLLDCAKYHDLHIFLIVFQMLDDFDRIYCIFLGQLGKSTWTTYQRHLTREIHNLICEIRHFNFNAWNLTKHKKKKRKKKRLRPNGEK